MIPATLKKILADLWVNKARSALVALSIAVGAFAVGIIISAMIMVKDDMMADYLSINPHTARIYTSEFDDSLLEALNGLPEIESLDASYNIWLNIAANDGKQHQINLNSLTSLAEIEVDQLVLEAGAPTLADGEIYLVMRLYWPKDAPPSILPAGEGTWQPPALRSRATRTSGVPVSRRGWTPCTSMRWKVSPAPRG